MQEILNKLGMIFSGEEIEVNTDDGYTHIILYTNKELKEMINGEYKRCSIALNRIIESDVKYFYTSLPYENMEPIMYATYDLFKEGVVKWNKGYYSHFKDGVHYIYAKGQGAWTNTGEYIKIKDSNEIKRAEKNACGKK